MTGPDPEPLVERVNRAKARWLKRVMYDSPATVMQKCFAFAVCDHLNCVTLDCWPSFRTVAARFRCNPRTVERAARGLQKLGLLKFTRTATGYRFAPVLLQGADIPVQQAGHPDPKSTDRSVHESLLDYLFKPDSKGSAEEAKRPRGANGFRRAHRGSIEIKVAEMLGPDGIEVLSRLAKIDDNIVDLLCNAYVARALTTRELTAARLAAAQVLS